MAAANIRLKLFKALDHQSHRFNWLRLLSQSFSLAVLVGVPLSGLARVDFWGGQHYLLFEAAPFKHALAGVIVGIAAMYVITFVSNILAGRLFCGWGCPVAQVSRFGEQVDRPGLSRMARWRRHTEGAAYSAMFVVSVLAWWVDLRVLIQGDAVWLASTWGLVAIGTTGAYLHGRWWRWEFCKSACPIGLYYTFVAPASYFGIHFRNQKDTCLDCDACDNVCPVDLTPRDLTAPVNNRVGLAIADAPGHNHCIECGDCIRACEFMIDKRGQAPVPLLMGYFSGPQRIDAPPAEDVEQGQLPEDSTTQPAAAAA